MPVTRVLALTDGEGAARLYAEKTAAKCSVFRSIGRLTADLESETAPAVVSLGMADEDDVAAVVEAAHCAAVPVGFIDGWRGEGAALAHADSLVSWESARKPGVTAWLAESNTPDIFGEYECLSVLDTEGDVFRTVLSSENRVLCLTSHGNGVDAPVRGAFLCGLLEKPPEYELTQYFPCGYGSECIRKEMDANGVVIDVPLISTSRLPGDVVIWGTCSGVLTADAPFDPRGGLMQGLLRQRVTRQVITTYKSLFIDEAAVLAAGLLTEAGTPLGEVARTLNMAHAAGASARGSLPWILLGDPSCSLQGGDFTLSTDPADLARKNAGLARVQSAAADRLVITTDLEFAAEPGRSWITPIRGNGLVLWLHDQLSVDVADFTVSKNSESPAVRALEVIWSSGESLRFTHEFLSEARGRVQDSRFCYATELGLQVQDTQARTTSLQSLPHIEGAFSGNGSDLEDLAAAESTAWRILNEELFASFGSLLDATNHSFDSRRLGVRISPRYISSGTCPYCRHATMLETLYPQSGAACRLITYCDRCGVISDADSRLGSISIDGPEFAAPGETITCEVKMPGLREVGSHTVLAGLMMRPIPGISEERRAPTLVTGAFDTESVFVSWTMPRDACPGIYYLNAPIIADGAMALAHRRVIVRPASSRQVSRPRI